MAGKKIKLPEVLDSASFDRFREILSDAVTHKSEIIIDAENLDRISTTCAQLFSAFFQERQSRNAKLSIVNVSDSFKAVWGDLGLNQHFCLE